VIEEDEPKPQGKPMTQADFSLGMRAMLSKKK